MKLQFCTAQCTTCMLNSFFCTYRCFSSIDFCTWRHGHSNELLINEDVQLSMDLCWQQHIVVHQVRLELNFDFLSLLYRPVWRSYTQLTDLEVSGETLGKSRTLSVRFHDGTDNGPISPAPPRYNSTDELRHTYKLSSRKTSRRRLGTRKLTTI